MVRYVFLPHLNGFGDALGAFFLFSCVRKPIDRLGGCDGSGGVIWLANSRSGSNTWSTGVHLFSLLSNVTVAEYAAKAAATARLKECCYACLQSSPWSPATAWCASSIARAKRKNRRLCCQSGSTRGWHLAYPSNGCLIWAHAPPAARQRAFASPCRTSASVPRWLHPVAVSSAA